jgi:type III pantothenate kinase
MIAIVGDIGNTLTKICLINLKSFKIKKIIYLNTSKIYSKKYLKKKLSAMIKIKNIYKISLFSSVVPKCELILKKFFLKNYKTKIREVKDPSINKIVKIGIKNKKQVGSDRIANAVGVFKKYKCNCIVLDFGTATTFDVITKNGKYNGGIIAPGVNLSIKSLSAHADQIPQFSLKKQNKVIGKNTIEALHSGFYWGYSGLINNIILKIEKETKKKYKIIFTGGYAELFKTSIIRSFVVDKNITIKGIIEIFKKNIGNLA